MSKSKPFVDFGAIKAAVSITQILEHYGLLENLTQHGGDALRGCCPIHDGTNPKQFSVSISKNCWNCFSDCQCGGNILDFVAKMESTDVHSAAVLINEWFELDLERKPEKSKATKRTEKSNSPENSQGEFHPDDSESIPSSDSNPSKNAEDELVEPNKPLGFELKNLEFEHAYFSERGISDEAIEHFELGFCNKGTMSGRVVIPIHNENGELLGYAGRWPGEPPEETPKYRFPKDFRKKAALFNVHRAMEASPDEPLVVVEGFFDCIALWEAGIERCVALIGWHLSANQEQLIASLVDTSDRIELLLDEDDAGRNGRKHAASILAQHAFVRSLSLPNKGAQPDQLSMEELRALFE